MSNKVRTVRPNRGIEVKYRTRLTSAIDVMQNSVLYWLTAAYRADPPVIAELAQDALPPSERIRRKIQELANRWIDRFNDWAPRVAEAYIQRIFNASDSAFRKALKDAGFAVEFEMTPAMRDALQASIGENVGLIKSIPTQYLDKVEGIVMRSYSAGRDLQMMVSEIQRIYPVTKKRAALIARDQSNKANAVVNRVRSLEAGITEAVWMHSHAGKEPRPSHVAADGKVFEIVKGCLIDGEYIQPGELINCRCTYRVVLP